MTLPHLPSYPRLKGPAALEDRPGSAPDHPIIPPEGHPARVGFMVLCYSARGWELVPFVPPDVPPPPPPAVNPIPPGGLPPPDPPA